MPILSFIDVVRVDTLLENDKQMCVRQAALLVLDRVCVCHNITEHAIFEDFLQQRPFLFSFFEYG